MLSTRDAQIIGKPWTAGASTSSCAVPLWVHAGNRFPALRTDIGSYPGPVRSALRRVDARPARCQHPIEAHFGHQGTIRWRS
jgi:hypothetical protein